MFLTFLRFELGFWFKSYMVWVFLAVLTLIMMSILMAQEAVLESILFGNSFRNSPYVIMRLYGMTAVFGCLMVVAFVNSAATRDFAYDSHQLIFTKPIKKSGYLLGRFVGAMIISLLPMLGASLAIFISQILTPGPQWGPISWSAHFWGILLFAIPNTFFVSAVVFSIAVWTRSALASFLGILGLMVALAISDALLGSLANEDFAAIAEPFGDRALTTATSYWTVAEKNVNSIHNLSLDKLGIFLANRVLWIGIGCVFFVAGYLKFSFTTRPGWIEKLFDSFKSSIQQSVAVPFHTADVPTVTEQHGFVARVKQLLRMTFLELWTTMKSAVFICMVVGVVLAVVASLSVSATEGFGLSSLPVTFSMVSIIRESLSQFLIVLITFYAGVFVWKERDAKLDEIFDALPVPSWLSFASKLIALVIAIAFVILIGISCGLFYQLISMFFDFQVRVYFQELLFIDMVQMGCLIVLAILCHVVSPNKYIGYFVFIAFLVANTLFWPLLGIESKMFQYGVLPNYTYSDLFGRQPYSPAIRWFAVYWGLLASLLGVVAILLWPRGKESGWRKRIELAQPRWQGGLRFASVILIIAWTASFAWVYWNTQVLNTYSTEKQKLQDRADYEKEYKALANKPQPRITDIRYDIDVFPHDRRLVMKGKQKLANKEDVPIDSIYVIKTDLFETEVSIEGASVSQTDDDLGMLTFKVDPPMLPGSTRQMDFTVSYEPRGFENSVQVEQVVQNGTFFNNQIAPQIGYQTQYQLTERIQRWNHGLSGDGFHPLAPDDIQARRNHYLSSSSDWVNVETVISTSDDQIAIAPGSLIKSWNENGRKYFHYKLDHPSLNFYSFVSARYKVDAGKWNGVDVEVYYHPQHDWNVGLMRRSMLASLEYYSEAFGPYRHKQARIVEFPRVQNFAQAFPGTMPYSEGVGFIADIRKEDDIDMVYYVVAHEMAHQWWAHKVVGANMRGATMLSETLAQYSALMVMEKEYGRDMMRKFLKYEMDNYLRARGRQSESENPLKNVESDQGYIHYNKGSVAMYHLKEMIGEDKLNAALRSVVDKFGYAEGPYPTSVDLIAAIREQTPPEHHGLLTDLFENITLFENRTLRAEYSKIEETKFQVTLDVEFKKLRADSKGVEVEIELDDWIEIGAFAKPDPGRLFGKTLHRERVRVTQANSTYSFTVAEEPALVGVDPFSLLIDRNGADNSRKPTLIE